ncbi:MAG: MurR/RpiR family transcriptional regulator [Candidatus Excrementavichristensenella sp.]
MNQTPSITTMIRQCYSYLTGNEQKIASYVLDHSQEVPFMRIQDLALSAGVANSAVIRFCKTLGFSGYSEFRFKLRREEGNDLESFMLPTIDRNDDTPKVIQKVFLSNIHALNTALEQLDMDAVEGSLQILRGASRIVLLGTGTSEPAVLSAMYSLTQFGFNAVYATNGVTMRVGGMNMQPGEVAVGISYCGHTRDTVESLWLAHENGASTIALTGYPDSELCRNADVVLCAPPENIPYLADGAITSTRNSLICLLDALIIALACRDYDASIERIHRRNTHIFPHVRL